MPKLKTRNRASMKSGRIPPEKIEDERFGCLMAWLMFILAICLFSLVNDIINYRPMMFMLNLMSDLGVAIGARGVFPQPWELPISMLLNALRILFALALLYRQKWGLYGVIGVHVLSFIIELLLGYFEFSSLTRLLIVPGLTAWLAWSMWKYLE